jgi:hypothetical protein
VLEVQIHDAKMRMAAIPYSLDVVWQQRIQAVVNDPTRGSADPENELLRKALDKLGGTKIDQRLRDWLVEADPFRQKFDEGAIAKRGTELLESLKMCFEIADERAATKELQPDLMALTDVVRTRMSRILVGSRPDSPARNVPHQMYLELQGAISRPIDALRAKVRTAAENAGDPPDDAEGDWQDGVQEKINKITKNYASNPVFLWEVTYVRGLKDADTLTHGRNFEFTKIFKSRNFDDQMIQLYTAIKGDPTAKDYVMRVRNAAWPVQETINLYLDAIDQKWGGGKEDIKATLEQTLCAVADRVLKEVNFVISSKLAEGEGE